MQPDKVFVELLAKHQNIIHKVCFMYMQHANDREDLFQEISLQAWKSFSSFKNQSQFSTWLYRVALNTAITFFKKENRKRQLIITNDEVFSDQSEEPNLAEEQTAFMYKAISNLGDVDKALVMLYIDDYSYNEIAEILGISANHVAVKMNRIKSRLKEEGLKYYQM